MKLNLRIKTGIVVMAVYLGFAAAVLIYTGFFCPNIYCKAFNVIPLIPWAAWLEDAARNSKLVFASLLLLNAALAFLTGFAISAIFGKKAEK